jgi:hypothetical protein
MSDNIKDIEKFKSLLSKFHPKVNCPTFLEICGFPSHENVVSNILGFFFDPGEAHGFDDLFLRAFLSSGGCDIEDEERLSNIEVYREVPTPESKRLDLLIEGDDHIIAIENKLHGKTDNPFKIYSNYVKKRGKGKKTLFYYLSLYPTLLELFDFKQIHYKDFIKILRSRLEKAKNTKYKTFALDFLDALDNLGKETRMDKDILKLFDDEYDKIASLLKEVNKFKDELRKKVADLKNEVDYSGLESSVKQGFYRETDELFDFLGYYITARDKSLPVIGIDAKITTSGWKITIFHPKPKEENLNDLKTLLTDLEIIPPKRNAKVDHRFLCKKFEYTENLNNIAKYLQDILIKISNRYK